MPPFCFRINEHLIRFATDYVTFISYLNNRVFSVEGLVASRNFDVAKLYICNRMLAKLRESSSTALSDTSSISTKFGIPRYRKYITIEKTFSDPKIFI